MEELLSTKFFIPPKQTTLVSRQRLVDKLNAALSRKLTLLSAPAGFGKTTLVSDWASQNKQPIVWLSLDKDDGDPKRFWLYFITALQAISQEIGATSLGMLQHASSSLGENLLTTLVNEIAAYPEHFVMVLDDFHLVDSQAVDESLTFLLEHLPPQMHLVMTTREDPSLPLARLRARGQLNEIRAADLRFTLSEATDFLNSFLGIALSDESIATLDERAEGWIAGLQLAALSLQGNKDPEAFIESFSGSHHFVLDYLVEEVLEQQRKELQHFLLSTSILERFCGELCDALLPDNLLTGQETLTYLEQANLFLIPLDNERQWYRYHKLFADLLQQRLLQENVNVAQLHIRASQWYEENGFELEAFDHAVLANDIERAERLLTGGDVPLHFRGAMTPVLNWLESLPADVLDSRPSLWVTYASVLTISGKPIDKIEKVLNAAEMALEKHPQNTANQDLLGQVATTRAMLGIPQNQTDKIIVQAERALKLLDAGNLADRTTAAWALGYAYQLQGKFDAAARAHRDALEISQKSGNRMISLASLISLGQIAELEYDLHAAEAHYKESLDMAGDPPLPPACESHLGLARIYYEWDDLDAAERHVEKSLPLAAQIENVDTPLNCELLLTKIELARRDVDTATTHLRNAERLAEKEILAHKMQDVAAVKVSLLLAKGDLDTATTLAQENNLPLSLTKVYLEKGDASAALKSLDNASDKELQTILLKTAALHKLGKKESAVELLSEALTLSEKSGLIRSFVDSRVEIADLLQDVHVEDKAYLEQLRQAFDLTEPVSTGGLIDPLSERELEVLQLIAEGMKNQAIADKLYLSLHTVKIHARKIYAKLGVGSRTQAVAKAQELGILKK